MAPRDSQRQRVYRAERALLDMEHRFGSLDDLRGFLDGAMTASWFVARWPSLTPETVTVKQRANLGGGHAQWHTKTLTFGPVALTDRLALHELAHLCTDVEYGPGKVAAHGWEFVSVYLTLMQQTRPDMVDRFVSALDQQRARRQAPKVRRSMTAEQRTAAAGRLVTARAVRDGKVRFRCHKIDCGTNGGWTFRDVRGGVTWEIVPVDRSFHQEIFVSMTNPWRMLVTAARREVRSELERVATQHPGVVFRATISGEVRWANQQVTERYEAWFGDAFRDVPVAAGQP